MRSATAERLQTGLEFGRGGEPLGLDVGVVLVDADGRRQPLCGLYSAAALARAGEAAVQGMSMHALLADLDLAELAAVDDEARDVDTWADVRDLREAIQD